MTKVSDAGFEVTGRTTFICDYSPPRSGDPGNVDTPPAGADFLLINRNPGRVVRTDSAMLAADIRQRMGREPIFALLTRDMNRLAIQSYLLGAQLLGLENVVVAQGDPFTGAPSGKMSAVHDYRPTELIAAIQQLNQGMDFRGRQLEAPTSFCIGAALDPTGGLDRQVNLVHEKIEAGADFLVSQPIFDPAEAVRFEERYAAYVGRSVPVPIYWGLQLLERGSISMGAVPGKSLDELEDGRSGVEIALELYQAFLQASLHNIYLLPTIKPGGYRDYEAARQFLAEAQGMC
ncbi:MAG: methylenetetrahydrofolate reductase [Chloroflexi bacterium]|nr:methylenetetrahydrofolate reductase [Chloroflexota bacterium]